MKNIAYVKAKKKKKYNMSSRLHLNTCTFKVTKITNVLHKNINCNYNSK